MSLPLAWRKVKIEQNFEFDVIFVLNSHVQIFKNDFWSCTLEQAGTPSVDPTG